MHNINRVRLALSQLSDTLPKIDFALLRRSALSSYGRVARDQARALPGFLERDVRLTNSLLGLERIASRDRATVEPELIRNSENAHAAASPQVAQEARRPSLSFLLRRWRWGDRVDKENRVVCLDRGHHYDRVVSVTGFMCR